jgi:hypothetical protein
MDAALIFQVILLTNRAWTLTLPAMLRIANRQLVWHLYNPAAVLSKHPHAGLSFFLACEKGTAGRQQVISDN